VLSKDKILEQIDKGLIKIEPFVPENVCEAGYDLKLSNEFRYFKYMREKNVIIDDNTDYKNYTEKIYIENDSFLTLLPGETVLSIT